MSLSTAPESRTGVYSTLADVPPHHRLSKPANQRRYADADVWAAYFESQPDGSWEKNSHHVKRWNRVVEQERDTHHALAEPPDVAAFAAFLIDEQEYAANTIRNYMGTVYRFYRWLKWHTDHPHRYNPVVLAAVEDDTAREAWLCYVRADRDGGDA